MTPRVLTLYYGATVLFVLLDFGAGVSLRYAFLDPWPVARGLAYLAGTSCLWLMFRWPAVAAAVAAAESALTLAGLIVGMGVRALGVDPEPVGAAPAPLSGAVIANFLLAGGAAWIAVRAQLAGIAKSRL